MMNLNPLFTRLYSVWVSAVLLTFSALLLGVTPIKADTANQETMKPINDMVAAMNRGDIQTMASQFSDDAVIVDDFAPFVWRGNDAAKRWFGDFGVVLKRMGVTSVKVSLSAPRHLLMGSDEAYVVMPTTANMTASGKPVAETGDWTFTLSRKSGAWKITALTWAYESG